MANYRAPHHLPAKNASKSARNGVLRFYRVAPLPHFKTNHARQVGGEQQFKTQCFGLLERLVQTNPEAPAPRMNHRRTEQVFDRAARHHTAGIDNRKRWRRFSLKFDDDADIRLSLFLAAGVFFSIFLHSILTRARW